MPVYHKMPPPEEVERIRKLDEENSRHIKSIPMSMDSQKFIKILCNKLDCFPEKAPRGGSSHETFCRIDPETGMKFYTTVVIKGTIYRAGMMDDLRSLHIPFAKFVEHV